MSSAATFEGEVGLPVPSPEGELGEEGALMNTKCRAEFYLTGLRDTLATWGDRGFSGSPDPAFKSWKSVG